MLWSWVRTKKKVNEGRRRVKQNRRSQRNEIFQNEFRATEYLEKAYGIFLRSAAEVGIPE